MTTSAKAIARSRNGRRPTADGMTIPSSTSSARQPREIGAAALTKVPSELLASGVLDLQRAAGNRAVTGMLHPVQRVGGWTGADTQPGANLKPGDPQTGWNAEEHAVGTIRRIPIDGLVQGLQSVPNADGANKLTDETVAGPVKGPARSDPDAARNRAQQKGRGRAVALLPGTLNAAQPVDVLFHLHGHTENTGREFGGWRQHEDSGEVRDVARDRIAQQIEGAKSPQLMGILPQGVNESQFGTINPDSYIADAFDRLAEIGALKQIPPKFRVVLSAHSGGGLRTVPMIAGGTQTGRPQNLAMVVLFEALSWSHVGETKKWVRAELNGLMGILTSNRPKKEKDDALAAATKLRAYVDPQDKGYFKKYGNLRKSIDDWHQANGAKLGPYAGAVKDLHLIIEQGGRHEGQVQQGLGHALGGLGRQSGWAPGSGVSSPPTTAPSPTPSPGSTTAPGRTKTPGRTKQPVPPKGASSGGAGVVVPPDGRSLAQREAAITAAMVAAQAPANHVAVRTLYTLAVSAGSGRFATASTVLATNGLRDEINLTDALFALAHPNLGGDRIPADREDLKRDWREIRRTYTRPALAQLAAGSRPSAAEKDRVATGGTRDAPTGTPARTPGTTEPTKDAPTPETPTPGPQPATGATAEQEYEAFNSNVKRVFTAYGGLKQYKKLRDLYAGRKESAGSAAAWLNSLEFGTSFCGSSLDGIHPTLVSRLAKVEKRCGELADQVRAARIPVQFEGKFQPRLATVKERKLSDHGLGLALHLNYKSNPFVGRNEEVKRIIEEIANGAGQDTFWESVKGLGSSDKAVRFAYDQYAKASDAVAAYFRAMDLLAKAEGAGTLDADGKAELAKRRKEEAVLRATDFAMSGSKSRDPRNGFFAHTANVDGDPMWGIIEQLTSVAKLQWGGIYNTGKDLHHFALKV